MVSSAAYTASAKGSRQAGRQQQQQQQQRKDATRDAAEDVAASTTADAENGGSVSEAVAEAVAIGDGISRSGEEEAEEVSGTAGGIVLGSVLAHGQPVEPRVIIRPVLTQVYPVSRARATRKRWRSRRVRAKPADGEPGAVSCGWEAEAVYQLWGDGRLRGGGLEIDSNGLMWLGQSSKLEAVGKGKLGKRMGDSGLRRVPAMEAAEAIKNGEVDLDDFLLVSGLVCFERNEMTHMLEDGELYVVEDPTPLWPRVFGLCDATNVEEMCMERAALLSDGTGVWWAAAQLDKKSSSQGGGDDGAGADDAPGAVGGIDQLLAGLQGMPARHIADEALDEWLKFFAGT